MTEVAIENNADPVYDWRMNWLLHGGFSVGGADKIAKSNADFRFAIKTLENAKRKGYNEDFVLELIL